MQYSPNLKGKQKAKMISWLKKQIKDEKKSAVVFKNRGFDLIAEDKEKHSKWLRNALGRLM